jgi:hypothetical protein
MAAAGHAWPDHLVQCVAERNYLCVVGSGLSATCSNDLGNSPPSWFALVEGLATALLSVKSQRAAIGRLLKAGDYLGAAELLLYYVDQIGGGRVDLHNQLADMVEGPAGHRYEPGPWHNELLRLDPRILVTTNYDRLLERVTKSAYGLHEPGSTKVDVDLRSGAPVLLKIHGSVDKKEDMILCQSDFARLRRDAGHMFDILQALVQTRTCLFLGYSLQDPDIQLVMANVMGARGLAPAHFMLTPRANAPQRKRIFEYAYGVALVEYRKGDHADGLAALRMLSDLVEARRATLSY